MTHSKLQPIASDVLALAKHVQALIAQGLNREQVLERLADPANVGARMIDRAVTRRAAGAAFLTPPEDVLVRVELDDEVHVRDNVLIGSDGEPWLD